MLQSTRPKGSYNLIVANGGRHLSRLKYCHTCFIYRPERAFHCHFCGNCIHRFDHHCRWLGTCIGGRNYKQFILFLFFLSFFEWLCIAYCISHVTLLVLHLLDQGNSSEESLRKVFSEYPETVVVSFICVIVGAFVTNLLRYHIRIICKSQSTYENKKGHFKGVLFNPYKQSFCEEMSELMCRKRPKKFFCLTACERTMLSDSIHKLSFKRGKHDRVIQKVATNYKMIRRSTYSNPRDGSMIRVMINDTLTNSHWTSTQLG